MNYDDNKRGCTIELYTGRCWWFSYQIFMRFPCKER